MRLQSCTLLCLQSKLGGPRGRLNTEQTRSREDVPDHAAFWFMPFVNRMKDIATGSGRSPTDALLFRAVQLLSVSVQRAMLRCRSGLVVSCARGTRYGAGFAVPFSVDVVIRHGQMAWTATEMVPQLGL